MAFGLIYERLMRGRNEGERLQADVVLGMPGARERQVAAEEAAFERAGFEVRAG